jgi:hypothetical protein
MENGNVVEFLKRYPNTYCIHLVSSLRTMLYKYMLMLSQALDMIQGLQYLHSLAPSIIHGDLKGVSIALFEIR